MAGAVVFIVVLFCFDGLWQPSCQRSERWYEFSLNLMLFYQKMLQVSEKLLNFAAIINRIDMSQQEKEEKAKEFWEYYEATQGTITITDPVVLD